MADSLYLRHSDYLKTFVGCYDTEILRLFIFAFEGVPYFQFSTAVGAFATCDSVAKYAVGAFPNVSAVGAGKRPAFGSVGEMLNAVAVCPFLLFRSYWAQCGG